MCLSGLMRGSSSRAPAGISNQGSPVFDGFGTCEPQRLQKLVSYGGGRFTYRTFVRLDQVGALKKSEILATHANPGDIGGSADLSATSAMTKLKGSDRAFDFES